MRFEIQILNATDFCCRIPFLHKLFNLYKKWYYDTVFVRLQTSNLSKLRETFHSSTCSFQKYQSPFYKRISIRPSALHRFTYYYDHGLKISIECFEWRVGHASDIYYLIPLPMFNQKINVRSLNHDDIVGRSFFPLTQM